MVIAESPECAGVLREGLRLGGHELAEIATPELVSSAALDRLRPDCVDERTQRTTGGMCPLAQNPPHEIIIRPPTGRNAGTFWTWIRFRYGFPGTAIQWRFALAAKAST